MNNAFSQAGSETLVGNSSLPSSAEEIKALIESGEGPYTYSVEDYFERPKASNFQLSPNGMYLSYMERDEQAKNHLYVKEMKSGKVIRLVEEKEEIIRGYGWINQERIGYVMDKGGNENYHLFAVNVDGSKAIELTPFKDVQVQLLEMLKDDKEHVIIAMNKNNPQVFEPFKINIYTGAIEQLYENPDPTNPIMDYDFDKDGNLRAYTKLKDGLTSELYYKAEGEEFRLLLSTEWKEDFSILAFNYASDNLHEAYVLSNLETDKTQILLYDLKENRKLKTVFEHEAYDVAGMAISRKRNYELDYIHYEGEKKVVVAFSEFFTNMQKAIEQQFPSMQYSIVSKTDQEDEFLLLIQSDRLYGTYYSYKPAQNEFKLLYDLMPQLKAEDMAPMKAISFESRDGLTIHGYITLPKAALNGEKVPLIVNPHGGPQGVRDSWGFNPEVQLFASRGYATLQVNFRVSGGYGKQFLQAGFKQIGRQTMDDVEDGVRYVIEQGWVDPAKVAIYGGSHGGYAVLRGLSKTPELYACGVDYVGVSNLFTFMQSFPPYWKPYLKMMKEIWYDEEKPQEKQIMQEVSPVFHIDKIQAPLFVVQGANDPRVNIDESDQIVEALREKGKDVPYLVKYNEGHGFHHEQNRIELYKSMMGFFAQQLK
jgi:dipeptidyl aminopeptidase/acylaminoacyl peptidase